MDSVKLARIIATGAHYGQTDKGGNEYIFHSKAVAEMMHTKNEEIVAWLHDVVEDTEITLDDLSSMFEIKIVMAIDAITKREEESRKEYLIRVKNNSIARNVKIADLTHNSMLFRIPNPTKKDKERCKKYREEIKFLKEV